jgi:hypothetical protein
VKDDELHNFLFSTKHYWGEKSRRMSGTCTMQWEMRNLYKILVGKPEGKRPFDRSRCGCEDNIKMGLKEIDCEGVGCIHWLRIGPSYELL